MVSVDVKHYVYLTFPTQYLSRALSQQLYFILSSHLAAKHVFIPMNQVESDTFSAEAGMKKGSDSMRRKYILNQSALKYNCWK